MPYFFYILFSKTADKFYSGSCSVLEKRLIRHNAGATPSTKPGRPWKIVYFEKFKTKTEALKKENYVKRMKSRLYIQSLIESQKTDGEEKD